MVKFENLRARVYIVPDFRRNDRLGLVSGSTLVDPNDAHKAYFHLGAFKWDRSVPHKFPAGAADAADAYEGWSIAGVQLFCLSKLYSSNVLCLPCLICM